MMRYDGEFVGVEALTLQGPPLHYVVVDLAGDKSTTEILAGLQAGYPFPRDDTAQGVHRLLGPINAGICDRAIGLLAAGDAEQLGRLMREAQDSWDELAVPACPKQLAAPLLHSVLSHGPLQRHIFGGKGVGSQGDGTAQLLARSLSDQEAAREIIKRDFGMDSLSLTLAPSATVRKAVIPAAGFARSLYPASKAVKQELFPVVDATGVTKPAVLLHVEELVSAGVEQVVIVVQPEDVPLFERLFHLPDSHENFSKLSGAAQQEALRVLELGQRVTLVTQDSQEGFGHALHCAAEAVGDEPFLLLIGHHVYRSTGSVSVSEQVIDAYNKHQCGVVSLMLSHADDIHCFGTFAGLWLREPSEQGGGPGSGRQDSGHGPVEAVLADVGLQQYAELFAREQVAYWQLPALTGDELRDLGIPLGPRKRMLEAFRDLERKLSAGALGTASELRERPPSTLRITKLAEKPTKSYADENLVMDNPPLPPDTFLTAFGQYVLPPDIFRILRANIANNVRHQGEFQLTTALDTLRKEQVRPYVCLAAACTRGMCIEESRGLPLKAQELMLEGRQERSFTERACLADSAGARRPVRRGKAVQHRDAVVVPELPQSASAGFCGLGTWCSAGNPSRTGQPDPLPFPPTNHQNIALCFKHRCVTSRMHHEIRPVKRR